MNKMIFNIIINVEDFEVQEDKKAIVKKGFFYFQGQKYCIENNKIISGSSIFTNPPTLEQGE